MSEERSFERFVADHVAGSGGEARMPDDFYDDIHAIASRTRQRPKWLALIKEPPMRIDSILGVGSPTVRVAFLVATTLLLALLSVGALVAGAQSLSPDAPEGGPISFFTGSVAESTESADGACQLAPGTTQEVGGLTQSRGESWGCQVVTTDDPRLSGETTFIWNSDAAITPNGAGEVIAVRQRIENEDGAWEGTLTELDLGSRFRGSAGWLIGEGAYEGLTAFVMADFDGIWGVIRPDDGFEAPAAFVDE
jgi:hypothetical protein